MQKKLMRGLLRFPSLVFFSTHPFSRCRNSTEIGVALLFCWLILFQSNVYASSRTPAKVIAGWVEKIRFPESDIVVKAKLDTGAATSSIYATDIVFFKKNEKRWVRFQLVLKGSDGQEMVIKMEKRNLRRVKIKNHNGHHEPRGVVNLTFCFDGRVRTAEFTLTDRSEYIYPVLLGREFLEDVAIIDPSLVFQTLQSCQFKE